MVLHWFNSQLILQLTVKIAIHWYYTQRDLTVGVRAVQPAGCKTSRLKGNGLYGQWAGGQWAITDM